MEMFINTTTVNSFATDSLLSCGWILDMLKTSQYLIVQRNYFFKILSMTFKINLKNVAFVLVIVSRSLRNIAAWILSISRLHRKIKIFHSM